MDGHLPSILQLSRAMKIYGSDDRPLMDITSLERDGSTLVIRGMIFGAMPLVARLRPEDARAAFRLMSLRTLLFLLTLPFRRRNTRS
jgi:hypothetical protein